jgi:hypothetical protein
LKSCASRRRLPKSSQDLALGVDRAEQFTPRIDKTLGAVGLQALRQREKVDARPRVRRQRRFRSAAIAPGAVP